MILIEGVEVQRNNDYRESYELFVKWCNAVRLTEGRTEFRHPDWLRSCCVDGATVLRVANRLEHKFARMIINYGFNAYVTDQYIGGLGFQIMIYPYIKV